MISIFRLTGLAAVLSCTARPLLAERCGLWSSTIVGDSGSTLPADSAWVTIASLFRTSSDLVASPSDSTLAAQYRQWDDARKQLLRDVGAAFVRKFQRDTRVCEWLTAAERASPGPLRFTFHGRPNAPMIGDFMTPVYDDSAAKHVAQWQAMLPALRTACLQSPSPDSMRVAIASELVDEQMRPVELDLWFPPDTAHPTLADTIHWDALSREVLELGARFPTISTWQMRNPANSLLTLYRRYHPAGEAAFIAALEASPNGSFKALGHAETALAEARQTPMTMHVKGIDGKPIDLEDLRGKVVLLDFWAASWCSACRVQEPLIKAAYEKYHSRGLEIIGVALEDNDHRAFFTQYVKAQGIAWPQYFPGGTTSTDNEYFQRFGFDGAPQLMLLDKKGLLVGQAPGSNGIQVLERLIKKQLGVTD